MAPCRSRYLTTSRTRRGECFCAATLSTRKVDDALLVHASSKRAGAASLLAARLSGLSERLLRTMISFVMPEGFAVSSRWKSPVVAKVLADYIQGVPIIIVDVDCLLGGITRRLDLGYVETGRVGFDGGTTSS